ncbi:MAG: zeta toxin family protein [Candidatus Saccharibacteria bacterium]
MKSLSLSRPHAIIMVGIPGSGKSFFAEKFAETFNAPYVSHHKIADISGLTDQDAVSSLANDQIDELMKTTQSIVIEGGADTRIGRADLTKKLHKAGYEPLMVWVQTDPATAKLRTTKPSKKQTNRHLSDDEHDRLTRRFTAPHDKDNVIVISGKHTYASQVKVVLKKLSGPRAEISTHATPPTRSFSDIRRPRQ